MTEPTNQPTAPLAAAVEVCPECHHSAPDGRPCSLRSNVLCDHECVFPPAPAQKPFKYSPAANVKWLNAHQSQEYRGKWVALRNGEVLALGTHDEVRAKVGDTRGTGILVTLIAVAEKVPAPQPASPPVDVVGDGLFAELCALFDERAEKLHKVGGPFVHQLAVVAADFTRRKLANLRTVADRPAGEHPFAPCGYKYCDWPDGELRCNERPAAPPHDWAQLAEKAAEKIVAEHRDALWGHETDIVAIITEAFSGVAAPEQKVPQLVPSTFVLGVARRDPYFRKWMIEQLTAMGDSAAAPAPCQVLGYIYDRPKDQRWCVTHNQLMSKCAQEQEVDSSEDENTFMEYPG